MRSILSLALTAKSVVIAAPRSFSASKVRLFSVKMASFDSGVAGMRAAYNSPREVFTEANLVSKEPIGQFRAWFDEARNNPNILEANAMCLATASKDGTPSARFVLLKGYGKEGFKFFTNYNSRKGKELEENPKAALTFYWDALHRSVRVEGTVQRLSEKESDEYFHSRPKASQIGACASNQSTPIAGRQVLMDEEKALNSLYNEGDVQRPKHWGGYIVIPHSIEFWQGQSDRLHDRIRFRLPQESVKPDGKLLFQGEEGWVYERLSP